MTFEEKDLMASELTFSNQTDEEYLNYIALQKYKKQKLAKTRQRLLAAAAEFEAYDDSSNDYSKF